MKPRNLLNQMMMVVLTASISAAALAEGIPFTQSGTFDGAPEGASWVVVNDTPYVINAQTTYSMLGGVRAPDATSFPPGAFVTVTGEIADNGAFVASNIRVIPQLPREVDPETGVDE